jgi:outer membrane receptor protein involved in Fe transport
MARLTCTLRLCAAGVGCALAVTAPLGAQDFGARAAVQQPIAADNPEDATAAATTVEMDARSAANESVADVLRDVPGSRPLRTGTLGSYTTASLRGAEADHTSVLFGDLPIGGADAGAFNLDSIPAALLDRIVVYRGGAPVWLSQGAIGGVLQLVPRSAAGSELSLTTRAGSYGLWGVEASSAVVPEGENQPRVLTAAGVNGSAGDFEYLYDNNTSLDPGDDYVTGRKNADALDGHGLLHVRQRLGPGELDVVGLGFERVGGEPGSPAVPIFLVRRNVTRALASSAYTLERVRHGERLYRLQFLGGGAYERLRMSDNFAEFSDGGPSATDSRSGRGFGRVAGSIALAPILELTVLGSGQYDAYSIEDPYAQPPLPDSHRTTLAAAGELRLHGELFGLRAELRPSVRVEYGQVALNSEKFETLTRVDTERVRPTYRIAGVLEPVRGIAISSSVATGARAPSMLELFGDGGALEGNTALDDETSRSFDVGVVASGGNAVVCGSVELRGFGLWLEDQILYVRKSENQAVALNQASGKVLGLELGVRGAVTRYFALTSALTLLDTEGKPGKKLVNRPRLLLEVRPEVHWADLGPLDLLTLFVEANAIGASFDDPDNVASPKPSQLYFHVGSALVTLNEALELRLGVRNLADVRGSDVRGYQLPGRTVMASLTLREDWI